MIECGTIATSPEHEDARRLLEVEKRTRRLIKKHSPDVLAIESIFFFQNRRSALAVSQVKGIIMLAAEKNRVPIYEFSPLEIKLTVAGWGKADKNDIKTAVRQLFTMGTDQYSDHTTDALGAAACFLIKNQLIHPIKWKNK